MKPLVIDNLIPEVYQNELKQTLSYIPLYYTSSIGYDENTPSADGIKFLDNVGFSHSLIMQGKENSTEWALFKPILYFFAARTNVFVKQVLRVRLRLTLQHPDREKFLFNKPHIDLPDYNGPYKTLVYYINDSDGDTFIFDKFFNKEDSINVLKDIDKKIILQHTPRQGSAVYFEGHQYHAGNTPIKYKHRYVINFDFTI
jgi:hypothetical protein